MWGSDRDFTGDEARRRKGGVGPGGDGGLAAAVRPGGAWGKSTVQTIIQSTTGSFVPRGQVLQEAVMVPGSGGKRVTLAEAISAGLFDTKTGTFFDARTNKRWTMEDALREGIVGEELINDLWKPSGLSQGGGKEWTVIDAILQGIFDPIAGMIHHPSVQTPLSLLDAVEKGLMTRDAAQTLSFVDISTKATNLMHGFYGLRDYTTAALPVSLHDVVSKGLYDARSGNIIEPITNETMSVAKAIEKKIVDPNIREVVNTSTGEVYTVAEGIKRGVIDQNEGTFFDVKSRAKLALHDAARRGFLRKPTTLYGALTQGLLNAEGLFRDTSGETERKLTLTQAITEGLVDSEDKCLLDPRTNALMSLREAMEKGVVNPRGLFVDPVGGGTIPIYQAVNEGLACLISRDVCFAERSVVDPNTGQRVTLVEAMTRGVVDPKTGAFVDRRTGRKASLSDVARGGGDEREIGAEGGGAQRHLRPSGQLPLNIGPHRGRLVQHHHGADHRPLDQRLNLDGGRRGSSAHQRRRGDEADGDDVPSGRRDDGRLGGEGQELGHAAYEDHDGGGRRAGGVD